MKLSRGAAVNLNETKVIDLLDLRVEVMVDPVTGCPKIIVQTDKLLSKDFIQVEVDGHIVHAGNYHEDISYTRVYGQGVKTENECDFSD